jgi:NhaP-type Na+/H+ or K+/H+ antiporter
MLKKIPEEHRKRFIINTFIYIPLGLAISLVMLKLIAKFVGIKPDLGLIIVVILSLIFATIFSVWHFYNQLSKSKKERNNDIHHQ